MLKIKPIREKSEQERMCSLCGVDYKGTFDDEAMFILGRGVENFIDSVGAHDAYYGGGDTEFVRSLGFSEKDGKLYMDLSAFFADPCKNKK